MASDVLFTPTQLGALKLKNRFVMAPLTRSRANEMGVPADFATEYYAQRAGAGLIITEATQASFQGMGYPRTPGLHTKAQMVRWKEIVDAVHGAGSKIVSQIWHVGRVAAAANRGVKADVVAPSVVPAPGQIYTDASGFVAHDVPRALATDEIGATAKEFATAARHAIDLGFDGVEVHSANGYLLHQFLSTNVNKRADRYGGSIENRIRMPLEVIDAVIAEVGSNRVGVRVSPGHQFNGIEEDEMVPLYEKYIAELDKRDLAYLHVMRPTANTVEEDVVALARGCFSGPMIVAGGYDADSATAVIAEGTAAAVAFGKSFIANPDLPERVRRRAALNAPDEATFYTPGRAGYTDYPVLAAEETRA
ncbi:N-ethylmaleimide reductase [Candidatus Filomicrobium marinum]|uniref:N-ethylmaleimide reductase n=1 Tax=Candidatus Filomicrobium marinum TaxID=1608628 RepID=A0A0D6J9U8_9HYPH|nr:alkene reductase [Candidatus Filomicrobium marinum]CFW99497.1 N-ethylmaleimide reductase [Candidatus Filomicrobium marinum]CPR15061.1 N-ethylmaleimide reductase [Candidatus Filomicrobium marinum]